MKDKKYCDKCQEETFRTQEDNVNVCQGCGTRTPRKNTKPKTLLFCELDEKDKAYVANLAVYDPPLAEEVEADPKFVAVTKRFHKLSKMEKAVIELVMEGKNNAESARILGISEGEITTYINRARIKLK